MTTLLATERIKLFTTRSPWWSIVAALGLTIGFAGLVALNHSEGRPLQVEHSQFGIQFGLVVVLVMAALAVTTEYRFSTIRATFQAVPNRSAVLVAKTAVVAVLAAVIGEIAAFGSWTVTRVIAGGPEMAIATGADVRMVAGVGLVYALAAVIAVAVGTLVRQSAGAISILLIWPLLVENLVQLIPGAGPHIHDWMPFVNAERFLNPPEFTTPPIGPWGSLAYLAGVAAALFAAAMVAVNRRDA
ncbi:ABC transporter permease [Actinokineospora auranticolor]|uniref:ABC-2 type transport system permease protein n=1 Tax=Actinokineospora auranticolor TaxID=155976 RepID=A0A2S6GS68_9PSEU|nr:ABC transporter permease [Actinokineospora auranticolor]PPK68013.1 ABC-2 type transport system permease protein [Actinokineospora auranticolor]